MGKKFRKVQIWIAPLCEGYQLTEEIILLFPRYEKYLLYTYVYKNNTYKRRNIKSDRVLGINFK